MFQKRTVLKNGLTKKIDDENTIIEEVLIDKDLSNTIRNEYEKLYDRCLNDKDNWLENIINYALFDEKPPKDYLKYNTVNQINHNAASFLENCGKKFKMKLKNSKKSLQLLSKNVDKFIKKNNKTRLIPEYAGHFQRFAENFIRLNVFDNADDMIVKIIPFLVENCRILSYQQLLTRILGDFSTSLDEELIYSILTKMLNHAYKAVDYILNTPSEELNESVIIKERNLLKHEGVYKESQQPLSLNKTPIPLLDNIFEMKNEFCESSKVDDTININWKKGEVDDDDLTYENIEDANIEAYLLIMSIRTAIYDQQDLLDHFRNDKENNYALIEALLYCGIYCDEKSIISLESFRLLDIIFNGSISLSIDPWKPLEVDKKDLDFYNKYADNFKFNSETLTYHMIHALPLFWDHRYNNKSYKLTKDEKEKFDISDYYSDTKKSKGSKYWNREKGETALEILQPCLLCEPPLSSALNFSATNILVMLSKERKKLLEEENQTIETKDRMVYIDGTYMNFYNHHFNFGKDRKDVRILDLLSYIVPLPPNDKIYYEDETERRRAPLSGFIIDFFLRMNNSNINIFFDLDEDGLVSKMGRSKVMHEVSAGYNEIYEYRDMLNYDSFPLHVLYNIPIHSEFYFGNDINEDEEEEEQEKKQKNRIIVDELDKPRGKKRRRRKVSKGDTANGEKKKNKKGEKVVKRDVHISNSEDDDDSAKNADNDIENKRIDKEPNLGPSNDNNDEPQKKITENEEPNLGPSNYPNGKPESKVTKNEEPNLGPSNYPNGEPESKVTKNEEPYLGPSNYPNGEPENKVTKNEEPYLGPSNYPNGEPEKKDVENKSSENDNQGKKKVKIDVKPNKNMRKTIEESNENSSSDDDSITKSQKERMAKSQKNINTGSSRNKESSKSVRGSSKYMTKQKQTNLGKEGYPDSESDNDDSESGSNGNVKKKKISNKTTNGGKASKISKVAKKNESSSDESESSENKSRKIIEESNENSSSDDDSITKSQKERMAKSQKNINTGSSRNKESSKSVRGSSKYKQNQKQTNLGKEGYPDSESDNDDSESGSNGNVKKKKISNKTTNMKKASKSKKDSNKNKSSSEESEGSENVKNPNKNANMEKTSKGKKVPNKNKSSSEESEGSDNKSRKIIEDSGESSNSDDDPNEKLQKNIKPGSPHKKESSKPGSPKDKKKKQGTKKKPESPSSDSDSD